MASPSSPSGASSAVFLAGASTVVPTTMRAFVVKSHDGKAAESVVEERIPTTPLRDRDLLVRVRAVGLNPVDVKKRTNYGGGGAVSVPNLVLGYDGAGVVESVGPQCSLGFRRGDEVFFAGDISRPQGSNAEFVAIDERIVAHKPKTLSFAEAAAYPLVALTGAEALSEQAGYTPENAAGKSLLVLPGAGGTGTFAIQYAKKVLGMTVIATASRPETEEWVRKLGADHVVNHRHNLAEQLTALGIDGVDCIYNGVPFDNAAFVEMAKLIHPCGKFVTILPPKEPLAIGQFFAKRLTFALELMFCRPMTNTEPERQGRILAEVSRLLDAGEFERTINLVDLPLNAENLARAHELQESGTVTGKITLTF